METGIGDILGARDGQINKEIQTVNLRKLATVLVGGTLCAMTAIPAFADGSGTDFVCPVFNSNAAAGGNNPNAVMIGGGDYTIVPSGAQHLSVPDQATNMDGAGSPGGVHVSPGDTNYSAIWNSN